MCFEHIPLPQLLPDSTHQLHILSFFSLSSHCSTWTREAPSLSSKFTLVILAKNKGHQNAQPLVGYMHHISSPEILLKGKLLHHYLIYIVLNEVFTDRRFLIIGLVVTSEVLCKHPWELYKHDSSNNTRSVRQLAGYHLQVHLDVVFSKIYL